MWAAREGSRPALGGHGPRCLRPIGALGAASDGGKPARAAGGPSLAGGRGWHQSFTGRVSRDMIRWTESDTIIHSTASRTMRIPLPRPTIRLSMFVVMAMAILSAMLVPIFGPMFAPRPQLAVTGPLVVNAEIPMWTTGRAQWMVRNVGDAPLVLRVEGMNACSSVPYHHEVTVFRAGGRESFATSHRDDPIAIEPGGRVAIALRWRSRGMPIWHSDSTPWPFSDDITFVTNDPKQPRLRLLLTGSVVPGLPSSDAGDPALTANRR